MKQINRKANHEYTFIDTYIAGIQLIGAEIKQIANNNCNIADSYCYISNGECFVKGLSITPYYASSPFSQYEEKRERKLLLKKKEINKIESLLAEKGLTLIVKSIFTNERGKCKLEIAVSKGKKLYDKRNSLKEKDIKRQLNRIE